MEAKRSNLIFLGYIINCIDFKVNKNYKRDSDVIELHPKLDFDIKNDEEVGVVVIKCDVFEENDNPFSLKVEIEGGFNIKDVSKDNVDELLSRNAVAILYPYLRTVVANITSSAGINTLNLPIVNVGAIAKEALENGENNN